MNRTDTLAVAIYARHGDMCGLADSYKHHDGLGCASGMKEDDMVLVARFAYLQEAIEYAQAIQARGVSARLVSRILPSAPYVSEYPAKNPVMEQFRKAAEAHLAVGYLRPTGGQHVKQA